jgi:predicted  nucleic acid-binding Zn-ribbon protein
VCRQLKRNQKGAGSKSLLVECPECGHVFFRKKKKFVDGPALQMGRATKTVCLDTAIIRCEPAQGDASTHVATSESGQLYDSKTQNASEVAIWCDDGYL